MVQSEKNAEWNGIMRYNIKIYKRRSRATHSIHGTFFFIQREQTKNKIKGKQVVIWYAFIMYAIYSWIFKHWTNVRFRLKNHIFCNYMCRTNLKWHFAWSLVLSIFLVTAFRCHTLRRFATPWNFHSNVLLHSINSKKWKTKFRRFIANFRNVYLCGSNYFIVSYRFYLFLFTFDKMYN